MWLRKNIVFLIVPIAALLGASGQLSWGMGWAYVGMILAVMAVNGYVLITRNPELIEERSKMQEGTKPWDRWLSILMALVLPAVVWVSCRTRPALRLVAGFQCLRAGAVIGDCDIGQLANHLGHGDEPLLFRDGTHSDRTEGMLLCGVALTNTCAIRVTPDHCSICC
jgi:hypothetical protein